MAQDSQVTTSAGIEFYGGYQVYSDTGVDLTLLRENLKRNVEERLEKNRQSARSLRSFKQQVRPNEIMPEENGRPAVFNVEPFLRHLAEHEVEFVLIGGLAMVAQGSAYITEDADICYARTAKNIAAVAKAFASLHPYLRGPGIPPGLPFRFDEPTIQAGLNFTLVTDLGPIDLLGEVRGIGGYEMALAQSVEKELYGLNVHVLTVDGLIAAKKASDRIKDRLHVLELEELKRMQEKRD